MDASLCYVYSVPSLICSLVFADSLYCGFSFVTITSCIALSDCFAAFSCYFLLRWTSQKGKSGLLWLWLLYFPKMSVSELGHCVLQYFFISNQNGIHVQKARVKKMQ